MKDLLEFILKNITTNPDAVSVAEQVEEGAVHFTVTVDPQDVGRVIGKEGKIIKAIRSIMRVAAIQKGQRVRVTVLSDDDRSTQSSDEIVVENNDQPVMEDTTEVQVEETPAENSEVQTEEDSLTIEVPEE